MEKSEREKMLAGEPYIALDAELGKMHSRAQELLYSFNFSSPVFCDYGSHIFAGEKLFINYDCLILDCNKVYLGDNVLLAPKVQIYTAYHPLDPAIRRTELEMASPVRIGDDVWVGGGAIVCPGVEIGSGTTIGAGSVVTRNIPANVLAAGNPCRVIRSLIA